MAAIAKDREELLQLKLECPQILCSLEPMWTWVGNCNICRSKCRREVSKLSLHSLLANCSHV